MNGDVNVINFKQAYSIVLRNSLKNFFSFLFIQSTASMYYTNFVQKKKMRKKSFK